MKVKRMRFRADSVWRADADFLGKLSESDLAFYQEFLDQELNGYFKKDGSVLPEVSQETKRQIWNRNSHQKTDIATISAKQFAEARSTKLKRIPTAYYSPADYVS